MSFSVSLTIDTGGEYPATIADVGNPTYNITPMFIAALGESLRNLSGRTAHDITGQLRAALSDMDARPGFYEAMNPENGWGSAEGAREFFAWFLAACEEHPKATVHVW